MISLSGSMVWDDMGMIISTWFDDMGIISLPGLMLWYDMGMISLPGLMVWDEIGMISLPGLMVWWEYYKVQMHQLYDSRADLGAGKDQQY